MARIPLVDPADPQAAGDDGRAKRVLDELGAGLYPNVFRAIANHPGITEGFAAMAKAVYVNGTVTGAQRELAYLTASFANNCHY